MIALGVDRLALDLIERGAVVALVVAVVPSPEHEFVVTQGLAAEGSEPLPIDFVEDLLRGAIEQYRARRVPVRVVTKPGVPS